MKHLFQLLLLSLLLFSSCKFNSNRTKVVIYTRAPLKSHLYIRRPGYLDEREIIVDSAIVKNNRDSLVFFLPDTEQRLFAVTLNEVRQLRINFINDTKLIRIHADYFADTSNVLGSPATSSLIRFQTGQELLLQSMGKYARPADRLKKLGITGKPLAEAAKLYTNHLPIYFKKYINYADTVKNPAAFMVVYNLIDFGNDRQALKDFIVKNARRFPGFKPVQELKKQVLEMIRIYEKDLNVGDAIPNVTLPDANDKPFSTASLKGKYYLVDLWSTWCPQCYAFKTAEYDFYKTESGAPVQFVGIAVDDNVDEWKKSVSKFVHPSIEMIDTKMWRGPAVNALLFDSIPYNFLVNPQGKIIAKAIKPDSLAIVLKKLVKK
jgi:thiol-disulfide isomerase/thioredoxin